MSGRGHLRTFLVASVAWAAFWAIGLPSYFQQYSTATMVVVCIVLVPPIIAIAYALLRRSRPDRRGVLAAWVAFYFSVPLAVYDWLYCGVHLGHGLRFLIVFWYLTLYYAVPWLVLPAMAVLLNRSRPQSV